MAETVTRLRDETVPQLRDKIFTRFRDERYTGENRCLRCTVLNSGIAIVLAGLLALLQPVVGGVAFGLAVLQIYFRGYLVPGTPQLTKRYLPNDVLSWFKPEAAETQQSTTERSLEESLQDAGVLRESGDELLLDGEFRKQWYRGFAVDSELPSSESLRRIGGFDGLEEADVAAVEMDTAFVVTVDDVRVGRWESRAAYLADVAAASVLADRYPGWASLTFDERTTVLAGLRLWLDVCPLCDGHVTLEMKTVESCCQFTDVVAGTCDACGRRLFEVDAPPELT